MPLNEQLTSLRSLQEETGRLSPEGLLPALAERFAGKIAFASSMGAEDQIITDMIARHAPEIPIFTIDTGRLPKETLDLIEVTSQRYGLSTEVLRPDECEVAEMVSEYGRDLFYSSVENRKLCCHIRKVNVLTHKLAGLEAWICGLRREQSITRTDIARLEWDEANVLVKVNPLADWTTDAVWQYIRLHNVPYNCLHDRGYPSIGCDPCTRAVEPGQDIRAGRWWWELPEHKECGLHVVDGKLVRKVK